MSQHHFYSKPTQVFWTCKALLSGVPISHKDEIREVNGWRLGAIVHRLRNEYDWPIAVEYRCPENIAYYSMQPGFDRSRLRFPPSAKVLAEEGGAQ